MHLFLSPKQAIIIVVTVAFVQVRSLFLLCGHKARGRTPAPARTPSGSFNRTDQTRDLFRSTGPKSPWRSWASWCLLSVTGEQPPPRQAAVVAPCESHPRLLTFLFRP